MDSMLSAKGNSNVHPKHSTPVKKPSSEMNSSKVGTGKAHRKKPQHNGTMDDSKITDTSQMNGSLSSARKQRIQLEFENRTIQNQRQELHLLVAELKDRDKELNNMVAAHTQQMRAWELDRQKILQLEEKCAFFERENQLKNDELRSLTARLHTLQSEEGNKSTALNNTQEQLQAVTEQHSQAGVHIAEITQRNREMHAKLIEQDSQIGQMEAREQELLSVLRLKDKDLSDAASHMAELTSKLQKMDGNYSDSRQMEATLRRHVSDWKNKHTEICKEYDHIKKTLLKSDNHNDEQKLLIQKQKQELTTLKKEVMLATEREKRKDQLLELQKTKQERSDAELDNIRSLYERQQRDLSLLHLNLESTKELLAHEQNRKSIRSTARSAEKARVPRPTSASPHYSPSRSSPRSSPKLPRSTMVDRSQSFHSASTRYNSAINQSTPVKRYPSRSPPRTAHSPPRRLSPSSRSPSPRNRTAYGRVESGAYQSRSTYNGTGSTARSKSPYSSTTRTRSPYENRSRSPYESDLRSRSPYSDLRSRSPYTSDLRSRSPYSSDLRTKSPNVTETRYSSPAKSSYSAKADTTDSAPFKSAYGDAYRSTYHTTQYYVTPYSKSSLSKSLNYADKSHSYTDKSLGYTDKYSATTKDKLPTTNTDKQDEGEHLIEEYQPKAREDEVESSIHDSYMEDRGSKQDSYVEDVIEPVPAGYKPKSEVHVYNVPENRYKYERKSLSEIEEVTSQEFTSSSNKVSSSSDPPTAGNTHQSTSGSINAVSHSLSGEKSDQTQRSRTSSTHSNNSSSHSLAESNHSKPGSNHSKAGSSHSKGSAGQSRRSSAHSKADSTHSKSSSAHSKSASSQSKSGSTQNRPDSRQSGRSSVSGVAQDDHADQFTEKEYQHHSVEDILTSVSTISNQSKSLQSSFNQSEPGDVKIDNGLKSVATAESHSYNSSSDYAIKSMTYGADDTADDEDHDVDAMFEATPTRMSHDQATPRSDRSDMRSERSGLSSTRSGSDSHSSSDHARRGQKPEPQYDDSVQSGVEAHGTGPVELSSIGAVIGDGASIGAVIGDGASIGPGDFGHVPEGIDRPISSTPTPDEMMSGGSTPGLILIEGGAQGNIMDSPATKLHKVLRESKEIVASLTELSQSEVEDDDTQIEELKPDKPSDDTLDF